jgi:hypothetical protein
VKTQQRRHWAWHLGWLLVGLYLVLLSGPIGDWKDYLNQLWSGMSSLSGHKFGPSAGLDRAPGWLVLVAGWCCMAHGLGGARKPPSDTPTGFARTRFRLRWLPVPILATLATYVALAYHGAPPLIVTVEVINAPPGTTVRGGSIVGRRARHESRYGATFDYLFGISLPPTRATALSYNQSHSEFRFPAGQLSLQNWQPDLERVFVHLKDESQLESAFVSVLIDRDLQHTGTISVTRESLKGCHSVDNEKGGTCLLQAAPPSRDQLGFRVVFDLADIELGPHEDEPFYDVNLLWGPDP